MVHTGTTFIELTNAIYCAVNTGFLQGSNGQSDKQTLMFETHYTVKDEGKFFGSLSITDNIQVCGTLPICYQLLITKQLRTICCQVLILLKSKICLFSFLYISYWDTQVHCQRAINNIKLSFLPQY